MYSKDDINLQKTYQQVNEVFGRSHAKLLGSKLLGKLGSETFEQKERDIRFANTYVGKLKLDAAKQNKSINDPRFLDGWMFKHFGFRPKELGIEYTPNLTQSDYIRYALAAREAAKQERKLIDREKIFTDKETSTTNSVNVPDEDSVDEAGDIMGPLDEFDKVGSAEVAPEKPEYQKTLETAPQEMVEKQKQLAEIQRQKKELEDQQASVGSITLSPDQEYINKLEQENLALKRELNRIAKKNLADTPESRKLQQIQQAKYSNDQWKRTPSSNKPSSFASFFDEKGNYIKPT